MSSNNCLFLTAQVNLYRGFLAILNSEDQHLSSVERYVEMASALCMREWRRLPPIVSHIHLPILQAAQQIMELQEACQIHQVRAIIYHFYNLHHCESF